jgi:hypothetical protein
MQSSQMHFSDNAFCGNRISPTDDTAVQNLARLIRKICEVDPLICPKCQGAMRVISFIEDPSVIRAILIKKFFIDF